MKLSKVPWTPFVSANDNKGYFDGEGQKVFINSRYQVAIRSIGVGQPFGEVYKLSVKRRDKQPIFDWRDIQKIKNELFHPEVTAIQIFPPERQLVDTSNQYWFFVMEDYEFPFGFKHRMVSGESIDGPFGKSQQRPFDPEHAPTDLKDQEEIFRQEINKVQLAYDDSVKARKDILETVKK